MSSSPFFLFWYVCFAFRRKCDIERERDSKNIMEPRDLSSSSARLFPNAQIKIRYVLESGYILRETIDKDQGA